MRKLFLTIMIFSGALFFAQEISAQDSVRDRIARRQNQDRQQSLPQLTIRAENMNESQTQNIENAPWMREIYRTVDLEEDKNASLYYPVSPIGDRMNLFSMIFKLLANNEITAYEYLIDGREIFTPEYQLNFRDLLDSYSIMYTEENGRFVVDDADIPSNEVLRYFVKEAWYFDKTNSVVDVKTLGICPVILRQEDFGIEMTPHPLFWIPYEEIRPYASRMPIMTSNLNNASNQTIDDFFRKRSYEGEIYKTTNMKNLFLAQMYPADSLKAEQEKIETQLKDFRERLWAVNETPQEEVSSKSKSKKDNKSDESEGYKADVRTNEEKVSKSKSGSSSSSQPVRSMRNRRGR